MSSVANDGKVERGVCVRVLINYKRKELKRSMQKERKKKKKERLRDARNLYKGTYVYTYVYTYVNTYIGTYIKRRRKDRRRARRAVVKEQTRFHIAPMIRDFTAAASTGSETSYAYMPANFLA